MLVFGRRGPGGALRLPGAFFALAVCCAMAAPGAQALSPQVGGPFHSVHSPMVNIPGRFWYPSYNVEGPIFQDSAATGASISSSSPASAMAWCGFVYQNSYFSGAKNIANVYWLTQGITNTNGSVVQQEIDTLSTTASPTQPGKLIAAGASSQLPVGAIAALSWQTGFPDFTTPPAVSWGQPICFTVSYSSAVSGDFVSFGVNANAVDTGMLPGLVSEDSGSDWADTTNTSAPNIRIVFTDGTSATLDPGTPYNGTGPLAYYQSTAVPNEYGATFQLPITSVVSAAEVGVGCYGNPNATLTVEITDDASPPNQLSAYNQNCYQVYNINANQGLTAVPLPPVTLQANTTYHLGAYCTSSGINDCAIWGLTADSAATLALTPAATNFYLATRTAPSGAWTSDTSALPNMSLGISELPGVAAPVTIPQGVYYPGYPFVGPAFQNGSLANPEQVAASFTSSQPAAGITNCGYFVSYQDGDFRGTKGIESVEWTTNSSAMATGDPDGQVQVSIQGESATAQPTQADGNILGGGNAYAIEAVGSMASGGVVNNLGTFGAPAPVAAGQLICVVFQWSSPGVGASFGIGGYSVPGDSGWQPTYSYTSDGVTYNRVPQYVSNLLFKLSDGTYGTLETGVAGTITGNFYVYTADTSPNEYGMAFAAPVRGSLDKLLVAHTCSDPETTFTIELTDTAAKPHTLRSVSFDCHSAITVNNDNQSSGSGFTSFPVQPISIPANTTYVVGVKCTSPSPHDCQVPYISLDGSYVLNGEPCTTSCYAATRTGTGPWTFTNTQRPAFQLHFNQISELGPANASRLKRAA